MQRAIYLRLAPHFGAGLFSWRLVGRRYIPFRRVRQLDLLGSDSCCECAYSTAEKQRLGRIGIPAPRRPMAYASGVVRAVPVRSLSDRGESCYGFSGPVRGYRLTAAGSMATAEYHRKQVELLLVWAMATAEPDRKAKLLSRALDFWRSSMTLTTDCCAFFRKSSSGSPRSYRGSHRLDEMVPVSNPLIAHEQPWRRDISAKPKSATRWPRQTAMLPPPTEQPWRGIPCDWRHRRAMRSRGHLGRRPRQRTWCGTV